MAGRESNDEAGAGAVVGVDGRRRVARPNDSTTVPCLVRSAANPQVAERLGISRRTVEAHLRSSYAEIGASTRLALAVAYREREPVRT